MRAAEIMPYEEPRAIAGLSPKLPALFLRDGAVLLELLINPQPPPAEPTGRTGVEAAANQETPEPRVVKIFFFPHTGLKPKGFNF